MAYKVPEGPLTPRVRDGSASSTSEDMSVSMISLTGGTAVPDDRQT